MGHSSSGARIDRLRLKENSRSIGHEAGTASNFETGGGMTEYWGCTIHFFLLTLFNFKNIGGGGGVCSPVPLLRGLCEASKTRPACSKIDLGRL